MENSSAFKNWINKAVVEKIASEVKSQYPAFNDSAFKKNSSKLDSLELKERVLLITSSLESALPNDKKKSIIIITKVIKNDELKGFELWPFSEYISQFGLDHFEVSCEAMYELTQRFTAEFAVRSFLLKYPERTLKYLDSLTTDSNHHVRRWVSEGSRPILPWGGKIPLFIQDPSHTLSLLTKLKFDEELYVRKSIANHLNDISKNHPEVVCNLLDRWKKDCPSEHETKIIWITRYALRTLIKKGHTSALKLMGVGTETKVESSGFKINKKQFKVGDILELSFNLESKSKVTQKVIVDYAIDFVKGNGSKGSKVYKLKTFDLRPKEKVSIRKSHSLKKITTMKFYSGTHHIWVQINGRKMGELKFKLVC